MIHPFFCNSLIKRFGIDLYNLKTFCDKLSPTISDFNSFNLLNCLPPA